MQWLLALAIAALLVISGPQILRVILVDWMQLYKDITLEQACLVFLVFLQTVTLVQLLLWRREIEWQRSSQEPPVRQARKRRPEQPLARAAGRGPTRPSTSRRGVGADSGYQGTRRAGSRSQRKR